MLVIYPAPHSELSKAISITFTARDVLWIKANSALLDSVAVRMRLLTSFAKDAMCTTCIILLKYNLPNETQNTSNSQGNWAIRDMVTRISHAGPPSLVRPGAGHESAYPWGRSSRQLPGRARLAYLIIPTRAAI